MEAITTGGAISANWVLVGVMTFFCFIFWRMLTTMQDEIKDNAKQINEHATKLGVHEQRHSDHDDQFDKISESNAKLADEIIAKLRIAGKTIN